MGPDSCLTSCTDTCLIELERPPYGFHFPVLAAAAATCALQELFRVNVLSLLGAPPFGRRGHATGPSPGDCLACLSAAAEDVWRAGCFLSYADTNTSTARDTKAMIDVIVDLLGKEKVYFTSSNYHQSLVFLL